MTSIQIIKNYLERAAIVKEQLGPSTSSSATKDSAVKDVVELSKIIEILPSWLYSYFEESILCIEVSAYRSAIIMAWSGYIAMLRRVLFDEYEVEIHKARKKHKFVSFAEFNHMFGDFQIVEISKDVKLYSDNQRKILQGLLTQRNECAHPSGSLATKNETLAYVEKMILQANDLVLLAPDSCVKK